MRRFEATARGDHERERERALHQTRAAQSSEMTQQHWSAPERRHRTGGTQGATAMSLAVIDSLRALRSYSPTPMSFISTSASSNAPASAPVVPSASSSSPLLRVQPSATERHEENCDHGYRFLADSTRMPTRLHTQHHQQQPRHFASIRSSDSFARPIRTPVRRDHQREVDTRNGFALIPRSHELTRRGGDNETDSGESSSAPREHENDYACTSSTTTNSRKSPPAPPTSLRTAEPAPPPAGVPRLSPASALLLPPPPPQSVAGERPAPSAAAAAARQSPTSSSPRCKLKRGRRKGLTPEEKRKARTCVVDGCNNYIVHRHRCFRHGGGKRCSIDGCNTSAKQRGLCWRHGGSIICKIDGCTRGVKSKGVCWTHGEGKKKQDDEDDEATSSSSQPVYYCIFDDCYNAPVVNSFCEAHSREVTQPGYVYEL